MSDKLRTQFLAECERRCGVRTPTAVDLVDSLLQASRSAGASDVHLVPTEAGLAMHWRLDGVLHPVTVLPKELTGNVVARLKVLAELLTYHVDLPQEGRIRGALSQGVEMRVSTFPTLFGEKAVVRLFAAGQSYRRLHELGLPDAIRSGVQDLLLESGGVVLVCGPAGSGKTTTIYACLRELVDKFGAQRSLVSLEDPIEAVVEGVSQSQINLPAGFTYAVGLKSLMRQDPEVILVGEIRDRETAETVIQASLTGHLVLTTFHAGNATGAICRLSDMGIEPYLLRTGLLGILSLRLMRKLCDCRRESQDPALQMGLKVARWFESVGCDACRGTGYRGRTQIAEFLKLEDSEVSKAILSRLDGDALEALAIKGGMKSRWAYACDAIEAGQTTAIEVRRVFGFGRAESK